MKTRNAIYNDNGGVDAEVLHELHGWIPYSYSKEAVDGLVEAGIEISPLVISAAEEQRREDDDIRACRLALAAVCDKKYQDASEYIRGISPYTDIAKGLDRRFYERAQSGELEGGENESVILAHESYLDSLDRYLDMIKIGRREVTQIINGGDLIRAEKIINELQKLGKDATEQDLMSLFVLN